MIYLIDSDTLIMSKNLHYKMGVFPCVWNWFLANPNQIKFIPEVCEEIHQKDIKNRKPDVLSIWVRKNVNQKSGNLLSVDDLAIKPHSSQVSNYVVGKYQAGQPRANFLAGADLRLITYALHLKAQGTDVKIVSHEKPAPNSPKKPKIPDVAGHFRIDTIKIFQMFDEMKAQFS